MENRRFSALEVWNNWRVSEQHKEESSEASKYRRTIYPPIAYFVPSWKMAMLGVEQLRNLQLFIPPYSDRGKRSGSQDIFMNLGTTNAGVIADESERLKGLGNSLINKWLDNVTPEMKEAVLDGSIPPIMVLTTVGLDYGNVPDGNHRVLAAIELSKEHEGIQIPAFVGSVYEPLSRAYNAAMAMFGSTFISPEERQQLLDDRGLKEKGDGSYYNLSIGEEA